MRFDPDSLTKVLGQMKWTIDNGGRRSGIERRRYSYSINIPERRSGKDRRCGSDRRSGIGFKIEDPKERREIFNT